MASVNDYLKKLLYQYDCVVVPELGAFLTNYQSASFTESSGLFLPPRKRVAFNEALRLDDGTLANYIMLHEPVTREGARRHISQVVGELRRQVTVSGRFDIEGIGTFTSNEEEKLQFDPSLRHNFFGEAYGMSAVSARSLMVQALEAVVVEPTSMAMGPVLVRDDDTTFTPMPRSRPYWRVAAAVLLVGSLGLFSYFSVIKPGQPLQSSLDVGTLLRLPANVFRSSTRMQVTAKPAIPSVQIAATPAPAAPALKPATVAVVSQPVVVVAPAATPATVKPTTDVVAIAAKPVRITPYFTVIAGSFSSKRNALRLTRQLRKAGYTDAFVIVPSKRGQLYKVAAAGSDNREEVIAGADAVSAIAGAEAWIYKK